jgi:DNA-binding GntR family transcriptional regulator
MVSDLALQRPKTLKEQSYVQIRELLTTGQLEVDRLYSAQQLAEKLHVSRTPVREALLQLEAEGLLLQFDGRGFQPKRHSLKEARDFFAFRQLLELFAVGIAAEKLRSIEHEALAEHLRTMKAAVARNDRSAFMRADEAFHLVIIKGCDNALIEAQWKNIRDLITIFGTQALLRSERMDEAVAEHEAVLTALQRNDRKGANASLRLHLESTETHIFALTSAEATA